MKDIAQDLGVSLMTVSKALRSHSDISEETRNRVLKRARELDYRPNWIARSLVTRRTYMVGLVIPDLMHSFFAEIAKGVSKSFEPLGYQIVIANSEENADSEVRQTELLLDRNVDGVIVASTNPSVRGESIRILSTRGTPYVLIDRMPASYQGNYVGVRDEEIGALATEHLIEQGCRRIAHLRGPAIPPGSGRFKGYRRALTKHGLEANPDYVVNGQYQDDSGYQGMRNLLALPERPDGVVAYNDPVAAGAIKAILEAGLDVPRDIAVIGAGNVHYSDLLRVPLSTIDQSSYAIGETAAGMLAQCIDSKKPVAPRQVVLAPRLIVRESSRRKA